MAYGTVKVDNITFTNGGIDQTVTVSGIVQSISGNITATGTIQGQTIIGTSTVSGAIVTGDAGQFTTATAATGIFTSQISGATITGNVGSFTTITGGTITLTSGVFASGTAAAPSVSIGTTDNGLYSPGTDQVAVATNGTGRLFVDASGRVGVGISPSVPFDAKGRIILGSLDPRVDESYDLQVQSDGNTEIKIQSDAAGASYLLFGTTSDAQTTGFAVANFDGALRVRTGNAERLRITSAGLVGIGTSSPQKALDVYADSGFIVHSTNSNSVETPLFIGGGVTAQRKLALIASPVGTWARQDLLICLNNTQDASDVTSADAVVTVKSTGNVGIGTTSPSEMLHVYNGRLNVQTDTTSTATDAPLIIAQTGPTGGARFQIRASNAADDNSNWELKTNANEELLFSIGASESARLDASGRLLVGTSSDITGGTANQLVQISASSGGALTTGRSATTINEDFFLGGVRFRSNAGDSWQESASILAWADADQGINDKPGRLVFSTTADGASSPTERLRITSAGLVGIGTSSPDTLLHLSSATGSATPTPTELRIATTTNASDFSLTDPWGRISFYSADGSGSGPKIHCAIDNVSAVANGASSSLHFKTSYNDSDTLTTRLAILGGSGNVGIGTTSPLDPLHVLGPDGSSGAPSLSSNNIALFQNDGNTTDGAVITVVAGTAATAQISLGDVDNGNIGAIKYNNSSNSMEFATNNIDAVAIDSSGRLLVGTSTGYTTSTSLTLQPLLQVHSTGANQAQISINSWATGTDTGPNLSLCRSDSGTVGTHTVVGVADVLGNVRFAGSDGTKFIEGASITASADGTWGNDDGPTKLVFSTTADGVSSPTERMRITSEGYVYTGSVSFSLAASYQTNALNRFAPLGSTSANPAAESCTGSTAERFHFVFSSPNGIVGSISTSGTATAYNTSSDYRLKENVTPVSDGITRLQQLKPSRFNFIADPDKTVDGFLAHEVQTIVPEAITGEKDAVDDEGNPEYQGIDQSKLVPLLTAALQEAIAKIEVLEQRLNDAGIN